jgi:alpha-D-ribose 1-methylphosphonate 5-triphosphate synthase subunit PhnG
MSDVISQAGDVPRALWPRLLGALPAARVVELAAGLARPFRQEPLWPAAQGLGLLCLREGCFGESFHLGEFLLAEAAVELVDSSGARFAGAARVMSSSAEYANAVAVLDAVLAHGLPGHERACSLLEDGRRALALSEQRRAEIRERTRVDFSLLASAEGDDDPA